MDFLNHLVAARLMKTAQGFERIGVHGLPRRLPAPTTRFGTTPTTLALVVDRQANDPSAAQRCPGAESV
ncbi:hypothetical protein BRADO6174 [Bradyrhizobium sp. ORS 278]|uniref:hypothetical protein n=1 Tax=Bradyrhizobium sp. (strain ORS 278) TaxID=114615 RepID=UPI00015088FE|nr:hypothetical protein [Bradyrhizobium sp. ORS 278]CAL79824.1 hypothetical protein BRADO6174 [Bradyrhizobium sp. ORS 278]